jgi:putative ABC transport system ATP-binding protein
MADPTPAAPIVELRDVRKSFSLGAQTVAALNGVSLGIAAGEFVAVVGASGSGKSTLLHVLGGLTRPTSGSVTIEGREYGRMSDAQRTTLRRTQIGFVFQKFNLLPTLTARDNIELARVLAGRDQPSDRAYQQQLVERLQLTARLGHRPSELSGGEQQRVAIARALINEPTGNLDSRNSKAVLDIFSALNRELGQTILMITHNPEAAARAHRVLQMQDGILAA